jgi:hypothetical protein
MHCGLEECEAIKNRFLRGINTEIQDMLLLETYNSLTCLVELASKIEIQLILTEETIAKPSSTCENKNCIDEMPFIICSAMSNLGQNKKDLVAHPIVEEREKGKFICAELNNVNDETHTLAVSPCEPIALVLNLSTTTSLEQSLVEPVAEFSLLQDDYKIIPCDKEKLCDHTSLISTTQLVHGHDTSILDDTHAEVGHAHCIDIEKQELRIISTLNILGYIDFNVPYNLNCLVERLSKECGLQYFSRCVFCAIGKYDDRGEILMHGVYMCSNLKYSFELQ